MNRQIFCYLDCYTFLIEQNCNHDYRPMYIGVWSADFQADENGISYFSSRNDTINWPERFQKLYGGKATRWLDHRAGKQMNFACLMEMAKEMDLNQALLILVDLFWLPYSPQYQSKHIPHVLIVRRWECAQWYIEDPYVGWQGYIGHQEMEAAFYYKNLAMGIRLDISRLHAPDTEQISCLMEEELQSPPGLLAMEVEKFITAVYARNDEQISMPLFSFIEQIRIISKRMKGYPLVIEYFANGRHDEAEKGIRMAEQLSQTWEVLILFIARLAILGSRMDISRITQKLKEIHTLEANVKKELFSMHALWKNQKI